MQKIFAWLQTKKLHVLIQVVNRVFVVHILLVQVVEPEIWKLGLVYENFLSQYLGLELMRKQWIISIFLTFVAEIGSCYGGGC